MKLALALLLPLLLLAACAPGRQIYDVTEVDRPPDVTNDSLASEVARARVTYAADESVRDDVAPDRVVDLVSTALDLRFDYAARTVLGTATHRLTPISDGLDAFYLHAVGMDIERVEALGANGLGTALPFTYDSTRLTINPPRALGLGDTLAVRIAYTAHPMRISGPPGLFQGGRGLYFIDPDATDPFRPTQLWTQGETEDNRRWFPTWDYPNDKMTFEIALTVPDEYRTASNGALVEQTPVAGGLRRDRWVLGEIPQVAYLAAVVVGDYATVRDEYRRPDGSTVPLEYIVEPEFAGDAQRIFGRTPDMIAAFEAETGVRYPWPNYKQVTVRDFTAGGMENTTLTIMYEGLQTHARGFLDNDGQDLIAHELAHQWFGDLTTTEDWANLALNESFATHFEGIYLERAFGRDRMQAHDLGDRASYFSQARTFRRPIVWYGYETPGEMFDNHTYPKGGQVLRMLRFELGQEAYTRGLQRFLTEHGGRSVELADLRQAMEEASGRSLQRFFSQWFESPGHPALDVEQAYFPGSNLYTIQVTQTQDQTQEPVFHFDVNVEFNYPSAPRELRRLRVTNADTTFRFTLPQAPRFVRFDEGDHVLAEIALEQPLEEQLIMAREDDEFAGRYDAVEALAVRAAGPQIREALVAATREADPVIRRRAVRALAASYGRAAGVPEALAAATRDANPEVRTEALRGLAGLGGYAGLESLLQTALRDSSYAVVRAAVAAYAQQIPSRAFAAYDAAGLLDEVTWQAEIERAVVPALALQMLRSGTAESVTGPAEAARAGAYLRTQATTNPSAELREAALSALVTLAGREGAAFTALQAEARMAALDRLSDPDAPVRRSAAEALGTYGTAADTPALDARAAAETDDDARTAIQAAAEQIRARGTGTRIGN